MTLILEKLDYVMLKTDTFEILLHMILLVLKQKYYSHSPSFVANYRPQYSWTLLVIG